MLSFLEIRSLIKRAVDHCHRTNRVRGLLCFKCNTALGCINDNKEILQEMINYLNKYTYV